ncbi:MAG: SUMF1/EgtB/PvdO family nonheme iron enzyme [Pirellulales bacterium]|nr:SUMF1/EgtB/PvdO family nonheme iron enzyme [Pirellulales bacterium]
MYRHNGIALVGCGILCTLMAGAVSADVFSMSGGAYSLEFVTVDNPGNGPDATGYGAVDRTFGIGKYEVTAAQYTEFLNAVARTSDPYGLWNYNMQGALYKPGIIRGGSAGNYQYTVSEDKANLPVGNISWGDAARFCNWLANDQPTGEQGLGTTEDGSYFLNGATTDAALMAVTRKPGAAYFLPNEDEWYKAAYHCGDGDTANYWAYPTASNEEPSSDMSDPDPGNTANVWRSSGVGFAPVGGCEHSPSAYGTFDQGGNVWEWNEAVIGEKRGLRGGAFGDSVDRLAATYRYQALPTKEHISWSCDIGFRVGTIPEPSVLAAAIAGLLALGVVGLRRRLG